MWAWQAYGGDGIKTNGILQISAQDVALHVCCSGHMSTIAENLREVWKREDQASGGPANTNRLFSCTLKSYDFLFQLFLTPVNLDWPVFYNLGIDLGLDSMWDGL